VALPDYRKAEQGTLLQWIGSGGDSAITLASLANGSARMGVYDDLGATWDQDMAARLVCEFASAPTAGESVEAYLAFSHNNSVWPAGVSGSDAAWPADGNEDEWKKQLGPPVCWLITTNDSNGTVQIGPWHRFRPNARYTAPVVDNNSGVALHTTVANLRFEILPLRDLIQDAA